MLAFGIAHGSQRREGGSTEIRLQAGENCPDGARFLPRQSTASEDVGNLALFSIGEQAERWEPRSQGRVGGLVQRFIRLHAANNEEQFAQWVSLVPMRMISIPH